MDEPQTEPSGSQRRRRLGSSDLEVTAFGFGTAPLGEHKMLVPEAAAEETLEAAFQSGIRYFDTAPFYGYGLAEHRVGRFLRQGPRSECVFSTKVGRLLRPRRAADQGPRPFKGGLEFEPVFDYSYAGTMRSIEDSLQRLGLARIDIALIHDIDRWTHGDAFPARLREALDGAYPALCRLRSEGVVAAIGIGVNEVQTCLDFAEHGELDCIMLAGRYTLLEQDAIEKLLPLCAQRKISLLVAAPFNSGILATGSVENAQYNYRPAPPEVLGRVRSIEAVCGEYDVPLAAAALQFPLGHPAVASVVAGAVSAVEVERNRVLMHHPVPLDFWLDLKSRGLLHPDAPTPAGKSE
ncbi:aldo/keto reductase [Chelativorans sp.]|uniref:aldo/keto reductase n=1 Tax=Chelativorans sp. TaxID=2203393 RepID=UPI0028110B14|nr:aldo/keto reductase [Chelativorans sp.]